MIEITKEGLLRFKNGLPRGRSNFDHSGGALVETRGHLLSTLDNLRHTPSPFSWCRPWRMTRWTPLRSSGGLINPGQEKGLLGLCRPLSYKPVVACGKIHFPEPTGRENRSGRLTLRGPLDKAASARSMIRFLPLS